MNLRLPIGMLLLALAALAGCGKIESNDPKPRLDAVNAAGSAFAATLLGTRKQLEFQLRNSDAGFVQVETLKDIVIGVTGAGLTFGHSCPTELAEGESCFITVSYEPSAAAVLSGELRVTSNAPESPTIVALSGQAVTALDPAAGAVAFVTTPAGNFGTVSVGNSKTVIYPVHNVGNAGDALTITGADSVGWTVSNDCPTSLAVDSTCNITVTFTPTAAGVSVPTPLVVSDPYNADYGGLRLNLVGTGA